MLPAHVLQHISPFHSNNKTHERRDAYLIPPSSPIFPEGFAVDAEQISGELRGGET